MAGIEKTAEFLSYEHISTQYESTAANVHMRWAVYEHAVPKRNIFKEIIEDLNLAGNESIVDIGCADGRKLFEPLVQDFGHRGQILGIDPFPQQYSVLDWTNQVSFMQGRAQAIPLPDNSADVLTCLFAMYHVPADEQGQAFEEFKRVLKPGGKLAIATSASSNKFTHRKIEEMAARQLNLPVPPTMNKSFTTELATPVMKNLFNSDPVPVHGPLVFYEDTKIVYLHSLYYMADLFIDNQESRRLRQVRETLREIAEPLIDEELQRYGHFKDWMERDYWIAVNEE